MSNIVSGRIGIIKRLRFLPRKVLRLIYFSTVHCHLTYCVGVWGSAAKTLIDGLCVLQRGALKVSHKLPARYPTELLYGKEFPTVLTVPQLYKQAVCRFVFCCVNRVKHHSLAFPDNVNCYRTRYSHLLRKPKVQSEYGRRCLLFSGPSLYNSLPLSLRNLRRYEEFCRSLKDLLLKESR